MSVGECDKCDEHALECECNIRKSLMSYFEESLGNTVERRGDRFIIKAIPKKIEYNFRLPLLPNEDIK